jgi:hypothetical protein
MKRFLLTLAILLCPALLSAAVITDNFNRADNADIGANWDNGYTSFGACQIVGNLVRPSSVGTTCIESWNANSFAATQSAQVTLTTFTNGSDTFDVTVATVIRATAPATETMYYCQAHSRLPGTGDTVRIGKLVAGVEGFHSR